MAEARCTVSPARVFARPTADRIWLGPAQRAALSQLYRDARVRVLTGPPSSGKSTLLGHIADRLARECAVLHCRGPKDSAGAVLASLLLSAELAPWDLSEIEQRNLLTVFMQQKRMDARRVILVVDDAHAFTDSAWAELERLVAFRFEQSAAVELLMAGDAMVADRMTRSQAAIGPGDLCVHRLEAPTPDDVLTYLDWRLNRFEMNGLVTRSGALAIAALSMGRYAAADVLSQMALLLRTRLNLARVDELLVQRALAQLSGRRGAKRADATGERTFDPPARGFLLISRLGKLITRVALGDRTLVGRSEHNDVVLASPYLSRHHAAIVRTPDGYYIVDLNSAGGLFVNGRRTERAILCDRDIVTIGPFRMKVQIPDGFKRGAPLGEELGQLPFGRLPLGPAKPISAVK